MKALKKLLNIMDFVDILRFLKYYIGYNLFYYLGSPKILPKIITYSVNDYCNMRCKTCYIWKNNIIILEKMKEELKPFEVDKIFKKIGKVFWITITGGEPFMKKDLEEILEIILRNSKPNYITIATNGSLPERILKIMDNLTSKFPKTKFVVNVSIDDIGKYHDEIRGLKGAFNLAIKTIKLLKSLKRKNLIVGVNTVVSSYNAHRFKKIYDYVKKKIKPDSFIVTIAEIRAKLYNYNMQFFVNRDLSLKISKFLYKESKKKSLSLIKLVNILRGGYYKFLTYGELFKIRKFEGIASCYIMHNGEVWLSYSLPFRVGNLRDVNYNITLLLFNGVAEKYRNFIKSEKYFTFSENAFYVNSIFSGKIIEYLFT